MCPSPDPTPRRTDRAGPHPSHVTRMSDASTFDEICVLCGATDRVPGGWGDLADPCRCAPQTREPTPPEGPR